MNVRRVGGRIALVLVAGLGLGAGPAAGWEAEDCQGCHADLAIVEEGGGYLYVDPDQYGRTAHAEVGCPSCHDDVSDDHPDDGVRPSRAACADCHDAVEAEYAQSVHADVAGCTDCHDPHEVQGVAALSGLEMNRKCAACHARADVLASHGPWLEQPELHLEALPCVTCHTRAQDYVITFYVERADPRGAPGHRVALAEFAELARWAPGGDPARLADPDGDGTVGLAELARFQRAARDEGYRLWGMMTPERASHAFATLDDRWDCTFCHASGPGALQESYVALPDPRGTYQRVAVEPGAVLDALYGTPDFYLVGATRSVPLTVVGLAIVAAGLLVPLGHGTLRLLTRKNRKED